MRVWRKVEAEAKARRSGAPGIARVAAETIGRPRRKPAG
jgi:hypothetical protein